MGRVINLATVGPYLCTIARWLEESESAVTFEKDTGEIMRVFKDTHAITPLEKPNQYRIDRRAS